MISLYKTFVAMNERIYMTPEIEIVECYAEGVLCASSGTESLEETDGVW